MPMRGFAFSRALAHRNYRLFISGQSVSLIGTWMQQVGLSWLVYTLTHSAFMLGLVAFCSQVPTFFLAPLAGVLSDRWSKHRTLLVTQTVAMLLAMTLALLVGLGDIQPWQIILLSLLSGMVNAFDLPTRQAFLIEMVPSRADLPNAIALNSSMVNSARLLGPFTATLVIATAGILACFILNAMSFLAVLVALVAMRDLPASSRGATGSFRKGLVEGFVYAFGFPPIRALLLLVSAISILGVPLTILLPVFANEILHGGAEMLGFLTGAAGCGALASGLTLAMRRTVLGLGKYIVWTATGLGLGSICFSFSHSVPLSLACLVATGFSLMFSLAASNTLLQTIVDDDKRGRVMSMYAMAFMGTAPLGSLLGGFAAQRIGAPMTLRITGSLCIVVGLIFARFLPGLRAQVIPIYQRIGILPPVAVAVEQTAELQAPPD